MTGLVLTLAGPVSEAWAQDLKPAATAPEQAPPRWSIGAGGGQPIYGYPLYAGVLMSGSSSSLSYVQAWAPLAVSLQVETRVSSSVWVTLGGQVSYSSSSQTTPIPAASTSLYTTELNQASRTLGATGGARYVANPNGEVEIGGYAVLGFARTLVSGDSTQVSRNYTTSPEGASVLSDPTTTHGAVFASATTVGGELGMTFERAFTRNLAIRFSTSLVSVASSTSSNVSAPEGGESQKSTTSSFSAGLALSPTLQLRILF